MELFCPFEITREIDSANGAAVYKAKKEGDLKGEYILKLFSLERLVARETPEAAPELDPLFKDIDQSFASRVELQKKAAEKAPNHFVPILASGHDDRGAWYATYFYSRSIQGMLDRFVALETRDFFAVVLSMVEAALEFRETCGRSHGNLKPSNIFIDGSGRPRNSRVLLADPLPGTGKDAAALELADLRAVGEAIYQLVLRRKVDFASGWVILPVEATKEWKELFGHRTSQWLDLCNKLLDPKLSLTQYNLAQLHSDLARLKPKPPVVLTVAPIAGAILLAAAFAGYFVWRARNIGTLAVFTDPPGARLVITPLDDYGNDDSSHLRTKVTPAAARPLKISLAKGDYRLAAEYTADNGTLKSRSQKISVAAGKLTQANLYLPHGTLVVLSEPAGATLTFGSKTLRTPYTNTFLKPGEVSVKMELGNYLPAMWSGKVPTNAVMVVQERLERIQAGRVNVAFSSDPPGAVIRLDGGEPHTAPWITGLEDGRQYTVTAELSGWTAQTRKLRYSLRDGVNQTNEFAFDYGILQVDETDPAGAEIWADGKPVERAPKEIPLPLTGHEILLKAEGFSNYVARVAFPGPKQAVRLSGIHLQPLAGYVRLITDPPVPGIQITDRATGRLLAETKAGELQPAVFLPPTNYVLVANHRELGRVEAAVSLAAGQSKQVNLAFDYGIVLFTAIAPDEARATAEISRKGTEIVKPGEPVYQHPHEAEVYRVRAPGYQEVDFTNTVASRQRIEIPVVLERLKVPVRLTSEPPGARFVLDTGAAPLFDGANYWLPWGTAQVVARLARLTPVTNSLILHWDRTNAIPAFQFADYATVVLTNLPEDIVIKEGEEELPPVPGPARLTYDRPGPHHYDLYESGQKVDSVSTNLVKGLSVVLQSQIAAREFRNSIGLVLVKVADLFGPGKDGWVGKSEVTEAEYEKIMGADANPSRYRGADLPVENVSWIQATNFCWKLTQADTRRPPGPPGRYMLPNLEQWRVFETGADLKTAVYGETQPARAGSKGAANRFGLQDVLGNVREWLDSNDPRNKDFIGGGFRSRPSFGGMGVFLNPQQIQQDQGADDLGFRVIWVPNR